jgi:glycosyltransferase involved in cell wall biosynthesis
MNEPKKTRIDILVVGAEESWEVRGLGTRGPRLERAFARSERVGKLLVVNSPRSVMGRLKDRFQGKKKIETIYPVKRRGWRWSLVEVGPKHFMLNTTFLLPEFSRSAPHFEVQWLLRVIREVRRDLGMKDPLLWISSPRSVHIAKHLDASMRIFDTEDNLLLHPQDQRFHRKIKEGYAWAEANADRICILSDNQRRMYSPSAASKFIFIPNGVEESFLKRDTVTPSDIAGISRPRVVYIGVLQERFDTELMTRVIRSLPGHQFIFVGPEIIKNYFDPIKALPNAHFLGLKDYRDVPAYIQSADVCIIPHKVDAFTAFMDPIKTYEYLACGKPVVSTPVAGTEQFRGHIYLAQDADSFTAAIRAAVQDNNPLREDGRRKIAAPHTWEARVEKLMHCDPIAHAPSLRFE